MKHTSVLRRDVSVGNILIHKKGGLLCDWDLSSSVEPTGTAPRQSRRTVCATTIYSGITLTDVQGTWAFMSHKLTRNPKSNHGIDNDLESFIYVLPWLVMRFMKNSLHSSMPTLVYQFTQLFNHWTLDQGSRIMTASCKLMLLVVGQIDASKLRVEDHDVVANLLCDLALVFRDRYSGSRSSSYLRNPVRHDQLAVLFRNALSDPTPWKTTTKAWKAHDYLPKELLTSYQEDESLPPKGSTSRSEVYWGISSEQSVKWPRDDNGADPNPAPTKAAMSSLPAGEAQASKTLVNEGSGEMIPAVGEPAKKLSAHKSLAVEKHADQTSPAWAAGQDASGNT